MTRAEHLAEYDEEEERLLDLYGLGRLSRER